MGTPSVFQSPSGTCIASKRAQYRSIACHVQPICRPRIINLDFCKAARIRIYIYQGDKAVATGGFEPQTPDASGSSEKNLGIQSPRILFEEDEANVLIENRMLGQNWSWSNL